jgi:hypothetical protein
MTTELSTNTTPARGLALATFDDAMRFGKMLSESDFAPKDFRGKPASCVLAVQYGSEIGLSPMQAIQCIAVINGRPSIWGDAALALVMASPVCEYVREVVEGDGDKMVATCTAKRRNYPEATVSVFSMADAKRAGLAGKAGPWSQYPRRMMQLRARGFALRDAFPDVLKGLLTAEEAQDYATAPGPAGGAYAAYIKGTEPATPALTVTHPQRFSATPPDGDEEKADPFTVAQNAIEAERDIVKLDAMRTRVDARMKDKTFTPGQADDLLDYIHARIEFLESESEVTA